MDSIEKVFAFLKNFENSLGNESKEIPSYTEIYLKDELISSSFNLVEKDLLRTNHSEIICIEDAQKKLKKKFLQECELITLIEPCLMCAGAIIHSRIPKLIYTLESKKNPGISSISFTNIYLKNHFPKIEFIHSEKAEKILKSFFKNQLR